MARKIIILENLTPDRGPGESTIYRYAMWLDVPAARQAFVAKTAATSVVTKGPEAATAPEIALIQSGAILEVVESIDVRGQTLVQIETSLAARFTVAQASLNAANDWDHYGTSWDGAAWTINTVA